MKNNLNKTTKAKIFLLLILVFASFKFYKIPDIPPRPLTPENAPFYQQNPCTFTIIDLIGQVNNDYNVEFYSNIEGPIECFGLNSWVEYQPAQLIENGWDEFKPDKIKVWISKNMHMDLLVQSIFWLIFLSFIPRDKQKKLNINKAIVFISTAIFYLHLYGEKFYYKTISRDYDIEIFSYEFSGELYIGNYFLYGYLISIFAILVVFKDLITHRIGNLLNYLPFVFLIYGTFSTLNINIYLIFFSFLGLVGISSNKLDLKMLFVYVAFSAVWVLNFTESEILFDVDKLRGFINSSQTLPSLFYWIVVYFLFIVGINFTITQGIDNFDKKLIVRNFLIASSAIFLMGVVSSFSKLANYITYYFFGLNKFPMRSFQSIEGNTWRGIAPSAEGMGEFFAFTILFILLFLINSKINLNKSEIVLFLIVFYGLLRTNNFAAIISLLVLALTFYIYKKFDDVKKIFLFFLIVTTSLSVIYVTRYQEFSYQYLSSAVIYEGVQATEMSYNFVANQYGQTDQKLGNYRLLLELPNEQTNLSSSLRYVTKNYDDGPNLRGIPSLNSLINMSAYFVNRAEKWGIFLAKYDPTLVEFLFGYGPQQYNEYYFGHNSKYNFGLFLPHSSLFNYLIFFGLFGVIGISFLILFKLKNSKSLIQKYLIVFFILNLIKSDALLYLPNVILFIFALNIDKLLNESKPSQYTHEDD